VRLSTLFVCFALIAAAAPTAAEARSARPVGPYEGLASWLDIYDRKPWKQPEAVIRRLRSRGVRTLYLQTGNYQKFRDVMYRNRVSAFLEAAHAVDMNVVAWYVPSFKQVGTDLRRTMAAIQFETPSGHRFDSFAMDIEADNVRDISKRNARLMWLSTIVRQRVGADYPLGAIIPDPKTQRYWPRFPYKSVARLYDVILPMSYFTFRTKGYGKVYAYTKHSLRIIREKTGDRRVPIHIIGGLAGDASPAEVKAFRRGVREKGAVGASLYDLPLMTPSDWSNMKGIDKPVDRRRPQPPVPDRSSETGLPARISAGRVL